VPTKNATRSGSTRPPLQIVILRDKRDFDLLSIEEALERAFKGGPQTSGYVATGEDLGTELRKFDIAPRLTIPVAKLLDGACHTVVVAIIGPTLANDSRFRQFLVDAWAHARSHTEHGVLLFTANEAIGDSLRKLSPSLSSNLLVSVEQLAERALRPAFVSLRVLHEARARIAAALGGHRNSAHLTLFISHAKLDGLPLAQSIKHVIDSLPWLKSFYDARDLAGISDWESALEDAATSSLLIILRTDNYEQRYWCQKETYWAEEVAAPTVLVEARPGLVYPAGELPLERMPSVRIPDGNLYRILHAALRESLRSLLFKRRVKEMVLSGAIPAGLKVVPFSYPPGMSALLRASRNVAAERSILIYPDPPLRRGLHEAAIALVQSIAPRAKLLTPNLLATLRRGRH
jgi:hypothetical protein